MIAMPMGEPFARKGMLLGLTSLALGVVLWGPARALAVSDVGYQDQSFAGAGAGPSGSKPESKLWYNDGVWWASLFDAVSTDFHIFRLDTAGQSWVDTGVALDNRSTSRADILWDGTHLYVASHAFSSAATPGNPARLYRYSYDSPTQSYSLDTGFPVLLNGYTTETLTIAKDSTGTLWATWTQQNRVYLNHSLGGDDLLWGTPFILPESDTDLLLDDISDILAFGGDKIGVMWSDQVTSNMYFSIHLDSDPDTTWSLKEVAIGGPRIANDHINLKSDGSGRVYAAVKTSETQPPAALNLLLVRDAISGAWASAVLGTVAEDHTRPIVLLDEVGGRIHVLATAREGGGTIYDKVSAMDPIGFPAGLGTPVIRDGNVDELDNVTSTKQNLTLAMGLVAVATNDTTQRYWHVFDSDIDGHPDPVCGGDDCDGSSATVWTPPGEIEHLSLNGDDPTNLDWQSESVLSGFETVYDVTSGSVGAVPGIDFGSGSCLVIGSPTADFTDARPIPDIGNGFWYLVRARNSCGTGTYGSPLRDSVIPSCP